MGAILKRAKFAVSQVASVGRQARSSRLGWYLYDFGNSILIINGGLYFPQWLVGRNAVSDFTYNLIFILSSILLLAAAPILGLSADYKKTPFKYLLASSILLILAGASVGVSPWIEDHSWRVSIAIVGFFTVLVSYQLSLVFYNTLLGQVASPAEYEVVSGRGLAWGWLGGIAGILIGLYFSEGAGTGGIASIFPSALITGALMCVSLYLISRAPSAAPSEDRASAPKLMDDFAKLRANRTVWRFLLAFFLFSDAILTIQNNSTIYMAAVLGLTDTQKAVQFLLILITSAVGSLSSVIIVRRMGLQRALLGVVAGCAVSVVMTPLFSAPIAFSFMFGLLGLLNGAVWNISRVLFFRLIPISRRNMYFGFYAIFERFASILGPFAWSIPVMLIHDDALKYKVAWTGMAAFLLLSLTLLRQLNNQVSPAGAI